MVVEPTVYPDVNIRKQQLMRLVSKKYAGKDTCRDHGVLVKPSRDDASVRAGTLPMNSSSYANILNLENSINKVSFRALESSVPNDVDFNVGRPIASVEEVNHGLKNSLYGYCIGKRLAFPVVELFIRNAWNSLVMVVRKLEGNGYTCETIRIEYEWKLPRCNTCSRFGHLSDTYPKTTKDVHGPNLNIDDEGFRGIKKMAKWEDAKNKVSTSTEASTSKSGNMVKTEPVNEECQSDVEDVFDESAAFMSNGSGGARNASLLEDEDYDFY
ncbi:hypothetical protein Tco_1154272 [Tanacetum coccineum]